MMATDHDTIQSNIAKPIMVNGDLFVDMPKELYIPPEALEVFLEQFEGPLDLLLYLIKKQNIDILNIPIAEVTAQYLSYIDMMREQDFDLTTDYLLMASVLVQIKSKLLLPKLMSEEEEEEDPRVELIKRLQEYQQFKKIAEEMDALPREFRDYNVVSLRDLKTTSLPTQDSVELEDLLAAYRGILGRQTLKQSHYVEKESITLNQRLLEMSTQINSHSFSDFQQLLVPAQGRVGVAVSFIVVLELLKRAKIEMVQSESYGPIHLKALIDEAGE